MSDYFSKNLKFLRSKNGFSQSKLADLVGVNQTTIARWEDENRIPTVDTAYNLSKIFDVPLPDFLGKDLRLSSNDDNIIDEVEILFDKNKDILTKDDKETIKFLIEKRKREIDKQLNFDNSEEEKQ